MENRRFRGSELSSDFGSVASPDSSPKDMDRISELSDELLLKILLFLPTRAAVSTSLLSKRWEFLWMSLPKLEFADTYYSETGCKRLRCFLERNLGLHRAPVLESLCLELTSSNFNPEGIKLWVVLAISHIIRELEISYSTPPSKQDILPSSLYACKSLVVLKLNGRILLDVPRLVCLPSLKTLELRNVRYYNQASFTRLLSICPVLEHLLVDRYKNDNMGDFTIIMQSLLSLSIFIPKDCHLDGYVIDTPSLKHFKLTDYNHESHYCLIENMPILIEANVDVKLPDITRLIRSVTSVKSLSICSKAMFGDVYVFNQLEHLELCVCKVDSLNLLVRLLEDSPNLRVLKLYIMDSCLKGFTDSWNQPSTVPECLLSSLETFKWSGYRGLKEERDLVVYILKNASRLRTVTIFSVNQVPKLQMIQELAHSSRASTMCELTFR